MYRTVARPITADRDVIHKNRKCITYRNAARGNSSHGHGDLPQKCRDDRSSGSRDMLGDRQTHRQTDRNTLLPYQGGVTNGKLYKVTDFGTDRKPVCDFVLVNNTKLYCLHHFDFIAAYWSKSFWPGCLCLTPSFWVRSWTMDCEIWPQKTRSITLCLYRVLHNVFRYI